jgi:transposase
MSSAVLSRIPDAAEVATLDAQQVVHLLRSQAAANDMLRNQVEALRAQIEWFKRQVFGQKSERYPVQPDAQQMHLGEMMPTTEPAPQAEQDVPAHKRRRARSDFTDDSASVPFFDEARVPVVSIEVRNPEVRDLAPDQYEVVGQKVSHRLAQRPGAYVVLKYVRQVIKRRDTQTLHCPPAPVGVIEGSRADVSFIVGVMVDKFLWHLPLYRQHQRLIQAGFKLSRPWLTQLVSQGAQLLEPIYDAQLESIRRSRRWTRHRSRPAGPDPAR